MGIHHGAMTPFQVPNFITAPNVLIQEYGARQLSRLAASGELHRVRRGLYLRTEQWDALKPWEQYRVSIQAVHELAHAAPVFARQSAAQIMGLPLILVPRLIETVAESKNGGQSSNGVHRLPAIDGDPPPWQMHGLLVTQPHITARDLAVSLPLAQSLPAMDRLLSMQLLPGAPANVPLTFPVKKIEEAISRLPNAAQRARALRVLTAGSGRSQSAGESFRRAVILENGFPDPTLQVPFYDSHGLVGYPDFVWENSKLLGEFDGHEKYSAQRYLRGKTPAQVVIDEKNRENRLRALGYNVIRWEWNDVKEPQRLINSLRTAGLPQQPRAR